MNLLEEHRDTINTLCRKHKVQRLYVFGSFLSDNFSQKSDIDLLVRFEGVDLASYADNYYEFKFSLQQLLHRSIDLIEDQAVRNPYFRQSISTQQQLLYAA